MDHTEEGRVKFVSAGEQQVNMVTHRPPFPAIGLDEVFIEIDHTKRAPLAVGSR
jgi:hypothetical protein